MNRVCCGAVKIFMGNKSSPFCTFLKVRVCVAMKAPVGLLSGRAVLRSKMEGHCPDKLGGICDKGYHGLQGASRWFCKIYCDKAVIVGLIGDKLSKKYQILVDRRIVKRQKQPHAPARRPDQGNSRLYDGMYAAGKQPPCGQIL